TRPRWPSVAEAANDDRARDLSRAQPFLFDVRIVDIAPAPLIRRRVGIDDRVAGLLKMFSRVRILGGIAAAGVSARKAQAYLHPRVPCFLAILAPFRVRLNVRIDLIQM